jgi:hypothetical protein
MPSANYDATVVNYRQTALREFQLVEGQSFDVQWISLPCLHNSFGGMCEAAARERSNRFHNDDISSIGDIYG